MNYYAPHEISQEAARSVSSSYPFCAWQAKVDLTGFYSILSSVAVKLSASLHSEADSVLSKFLGV